MIQDVDESIRRLMIGELVNTSGSLIKDESQIVLGLPSDEQPKDKKPRISLYLHDVRENLGMRDQQIHVQQSANEWEIGKRPGALRLDLSYLVTVAAEDPLTEHRVLGEVLAVLIRNRVVPEKYLPQSLKDEAPNSLLLAVAQPDHPAHSDHPKLWQSIGTAIKPTITIVATAKFNPFETRFVKVVREAVLALGQGVHPEGANRQMDVRSVRLSATGIVSDKAADRPLANVTVSILGREEQATTDERGFFFFLNLPPNRYTLQFSRRGYKAVEVDTVAPPPGRSDAIEPMDVALIRLSDSEREKEEGVLRQEVLRAPSFIETGRRITVSLVGTLRFPDGAPAAYVPVRVGGRTAVTDEDGLYHFTGLMPGEHQLVAEIPGRGEIPVLATGGTATVPETDGNGKKAKSKA